VVPVTTLAWGAFFGSVLGIGLWSLVSLTPRLSRPRLANRLAPYLLDVSAEARVFVGRRSVDPIPVLGTLFSPVFDALAQALAGVLGGADVIERRLRQSGSIRTVEAFRSEQLVWGLLASGGSGGDARPGGRGGGRGARSAAQTGRHGPARPNGQ
jgi:tight adherence protein C